MLNKTLGKIFPVMNNKEKTHNVVMVQGTKIKKNDIRKMKEAYKNYKNKYQYKLLEIEVFKRKYEVQQLI